MSVDQLEDLTGILQQQQSRWHSHTKDAVAIALYRERMIISALRKAGFVAEANHRAEGTGENEWFTPPQ